MRLCGLRVGRPTVMASPAPRAAAPQALAALLRRLFVAIALLLPLGTQCAPLDPWAPRVARGLPTAATEDDSTPSTSIAGTVATTFLFPAGLRTLTPCDPRTAYDLGCNNYLVNDAAWSQYQASKAATFTQLRNVLAAPQNPLATVLIYAPAYLGDTATQGAEPLSRLGEVVADVAASGLRPALWLGRPEYYGIRGNETGTHDVVHNATARIFLLACVAAVLAEPQVS